MRVAVFHPGTQHSWQTALALQQLGMLEWFATSIFYKPDEWPYRLERILPGRLAEKAHGEFLRFSHPLLDPDLVRTAGLAEWIERIAARAGWRGLARKIDAFGNRRFVSCIADDIRSGNPFALWGFNGSSRTSFEVAREYGRTCILDRTIGDFRIYNALMEEIADRYGDWFLPVERAIPLSQIEQDDREYALADRILVGSPFAGDTIRQAVSDPAVHAKIEVLNYCYDEARFADSPRPVPVGKSGPVRFLFVGQAIPRKGIHHLLEAMAQLPTSVAELTIVGELKIPKAVWSRHADRVTHIPTVARAEIPAIMARHHVLVSPSYFEGSSLALIEALAAGLAIIQTRSSGAGVTPETGLLLDRPDTEKLLEAMTYAIENRDRIDGWRASAQKEAGNYSFAKYRERIAAMLAGMPD